MFRLLLTLCLLVAACSTAGGDTTTTRATFVTLPPVTTTLPEVELQIEDCEEPPVTFSAFCESFDLLDFWYVDQPMDPTAFADLATEALDQDFSDLGTAEPPRTLFCPIPDPVFEPFCERLAELVTTRQIDVGPVMDRVVAKAIEGAFGPFTYYLAPDQVTGFRDNGLVGGVGLLLDATNSVGSKCARLSPTCPLRIVVALEDNPGKAAGLTPGDVIVAVDGVDVDGQGFAETSAKIAGNETGTVSLTIVRDDEELQFTIDRAELVVPSVTWGTPQPDVAYLRIPDFESDVPQLVSDALADIEGVWSTMVLDLRDNPGGLVTAVMSVATEFIPDGTLFHEVYAGDSEVGESYGPGGKATRGRIIILVNEGTASAAEILAGALRDRREAVVLGAPTFGKDAIQIRFDLRNGGLLAVAVSRWLTPEGVSVGNGGLVPDVELELTDDMTVTQLVETALEAAR